MDSTPRTALFSILSLLTVAACSCSNDPSADTSDDAGQDGSGDDGETDGAGDTNTDDSGDADADGASDDADGGSTDLPEPEPEPFDCTMACATLADGGCLTSEACVATCEAESPDWSDALRDAFTGCVASDPLCFTTLDQCLAQTIHPAGSTFPVAFTGVGFDAYDGLTIRVWHDPDKPTSFGGSATIVDGAFAFDWVEPVPVSTSSGPLILWYVDVDADESCSAPDVKSAITLDWNQDLLEPAFSKQIEPPETNADFVCDFVP
jgi:hypothetical protein